MRLTQMGLRLLQRRPLAHIFGLVAAIGILLAARFPAGAQESNNKLVAEARALFKAVDRGARARCRFDSAWDSRPVLAETAQRYLKLPVHADLVVSEPPATPMQIIDQAG